MELEKIQEIVKEKLSKERYNHSVGVMIRCEEIAKKYDVNIETAKKVGIAHDIAKELTEIEKLLYIAENDIEIDEMERKNIGLLHAKIGADIAYKKFGFTQEMAEAIRAHTTGVPGMDLLAKILFIADRTSSERNLPDIEYINELLDEDIDKAILYILNSKIELQLKKQASIHLNTVETRNILLEGVNM